MKKKLLCVILCGFLLIGLTGCGNSKESVTINNKYKKYIDAIRNAETSSYFGEHTLGELYDNALVNSSWDIYTKALSSGTKSELFSVKGTSKFDDTEVYEVIYEVDTETLEYEVKDVLLNDEEGANQNLITLFKKSADELDSNSDN